MEHSSFTPEELILIEVAKQTEQFEGHHAHHHHHHDDKKTQLKLPQKLTVPLGLYSLKKLNAIDPYFLKPSEARLLQPATSGPVSFLINGAFISAASFLGGRGFIKSGMRYLTSLKVLPLVALIPFYLLSHIALNRAREATFELDRKQLINEYVQKYGEQFLLEALQPSFRL